MEFRPARRLGVDDTARASACLPARAQRRLLFSLHCFHDHTETLYGATLPRSARVDRVDDYRAREVEAVSVSSELELIVAASECFSRAARAAIAARGIGDDAAVLAGGLGQLVWTGGRRVGGRALTARNLITVEDLGYKATMAGQRTARRWVPRRSGCCRPLGASAVGGRTTDLEAIARGQRDAA